MFGLTLKYSCAAVPLAIVAADQSTEEEAGSLAAARYVSSVWRSAFSRHCACSVLLRRDSWSASKKMFSSVLAPCIQVPTYDGIHYARNARHCQPQLIDGNFTISA